MITVVTRWESGQMSPLKEWKMWRQLKGAFKIDRIIFTPVFEYMKGGFDQYATMDAALASCIGERVFLEPKGEKAIRDIPGGDIVLILGNTNMHNLAIAQPEEAYRIDTPTDAHLYGTNAAAAVLAIRHGN